MVFPTLSITSACATLPIANTPTAMAEKMNFFMSYSSRNIPHEAIRSGFRPSGSSASAEAVCADSRPPVGAAA
jgi:hypothetical protein